MRGGGKMKITAIWKEGKEYGEIESESFGIFGASRDAAQDVITSIVRAILSIPPWSDFFSSLIEAGRWL